MSVTACTQLKCDHPQCGAMIILIGVRPMDIRQNMPEGWAALSDRYTPVIACPDHAAVATAKRRELIEWSKRECAAQNEWADQNPPPKVPRWLDKLR